MSLLALVVEAVLWYSRVRLGLSSLLPVKVLAIFREGVITSSKVQMKTGRSHDAARDRPSTP